ncbi:MAG: SxtJ family membrane protein [Gemmatimonadales bacterium]
MEAGIPARLSPAEGRKFGFTVGIAFLALASLVYFWRHKEVTGTILGGLGTVLLLAGLLIPGYLGPVHRAWMGLAHLISKVTTPIFMGVVFYLVMTPIGLLRRSFGKNSLVHREKDGSFWMPPVSGGRSNIERQF